MAAYFRINRKKHSSLVPA